jgi:hypothetical protein
MRSAVGPNDFHPELRNAVQAFIKFDVESAEGRPSARAFFQEARDLLLYASSPQTILETPAEATGKEERGSHSGQNRPGSRNHPQRFLVGSPARAPMKDARLTKRSRFHSLCDDYVIGELSCSPSVVYPDFVSSLPCRGYRTPAAHLIAAGPSLPEGSI